MMSIPTRLGPTRCPSRQYVRLEVVLVVVVHTVSTVPRHRIRDQVNPLVFKRTVQLTAVALVCSAHCKSIAFYSFLTHFLLDLI